MAKGVQTSPATLLGGNIPDISFFGKLSGAQIAVNKLIEIALICQCNIIVIRYLAIICGVAGGGGSLQGPWELAYCWLVTVP